MECFVRRRERGEDLEAAQTGWRGRAGRWQQSVKQVTNKRKVRCLGTYITHKKTVSFSHSWKRVLCCELGD